MQPAPVHLACNRCGAALAIPPDPRAVAARCPYCGVETVLPPHVIAAKRGELAAMEQQQRLVQGQATAKKVMGGVLVWTLVITLVPIVITVVVLVVVGVVLFMTVPR